MLSKEDNELITRIGPGTAMGEVMRRYWIPALLSEELPEPDGAPVRVRLLGEDLVAFRDTQGTIGLLAANCPHRGASLFFGRNEEAGLRCVYHGWKFDATGACVDMPNEPPESNFKHKVRAAAYPCLEKGGVIWAYMGPPERQPPLPEYEWMRMPQGVAWVSKSFEDCNYLQGIEGGVDSSHSSFLHRSFERMNPELGIGSYRYRSTAPRLEILYTDYGYTYASIRAVPDENVNFIRVYQFVMPFQQQRAGGIGRTTFKRDVVQGHIWVPIDDEHMYVYNLIYPKDGQPLSREHFLQEEYNSGRGPDDFIPGTYKLKKNRENDWGLDREVQRRVNYTGIIGVNTQDMAIQETMGAIYDRTKEHLGSADLAVIATRRLLLQAVKDVQAGKDPMGTHGEANNVRPAEEVLPPDVRWPDYFKRELVATV
jgi:phthalate 4,5-dioxygenase